VPWPTTVPGPRKPISDLKHIRVAKSRTAELPNDQHVAILQVRAGHAQGVYPHPIAATLKQQVSVIQGTVGINFVVRDTLPRIAVLSHIERLT
jgi:hypothetical protein